MVIDLTKYELRKPFILKWLESDNKKDLTTLISTMAASTLIPCIVLAFWAGEATGWPPEIIDMINRLIDFYDYSDIVGKPENSPI